MKASDHLVLVDSSGYAHMAFAKANPVYRGSDGEPVGAVLAFMAMVWRMLGAAEWDKPTHGAAVFDYPAKNFRHQLFPAYKANRPVAARSLELEKQLPTMRLAAECLGFAAVEKEGWEADDVIATLTQRGVDAGMRVTIVSVDKDFGQLVIDGKVSIISPVRMNQGRRLGEADVLEKFGVPPNLVTDVQALAGDSVDNIPGVMGCGLKRAGALVRRFGSLEAVLANASGIHWPMVRTALSRKRDMHDGLGSITGADRARVCMKLVTLARDVELPVTLDQLEMKPVMRRHLVEILRLLEAPGHMEAVFALDPKQTRIVARIPDPFEWWREEIDHPGQDRPELPQCGYYKRRLVRGAAYVPCRIWRQPELHFDTGEDTGMDVLFCEVDGKLKDPFAEWQWLASRPIRKSEFKFEEADAAHARLYRPHDPKADPRRAIDISKQPAPTNPRLKRKTA